MSSSIRTRVAVALVGLSAACGPDQHGFADAGRPSGTVLTPIYVCNAGNPENASIATFVSIQSDKPVFAPLTTGVVGSSRSFALPSVVLHPYTLNRPSITPPGVEFYSGDSLGFWVTSTSAAGAAIPSDTYRVGVLNPDGAIVAVPTLLHIVPPPEITGAHREHDLGSVPVGNPDDPDGSVPFPIAPPLPGERSMLCTTIDASLIVEGTAFPYERGVPIVDIVGAAGDVVRTLPLRSIVVRAPSALGLSIASGLAPGSYGVRVTNPDGVSAPGWPQGCRALALSVFTVESGPTIASIDRPALCASTGGTLQLAGNGFFSTPEVTVHTPSGRTVPVAATTFDGTDLGVVIPAGAIEPGGPMDLAIMNRDGCAVTLTRACPPGASPSSDPTMCTGPRGTGPAGLTLYADPTIVSVSPDHVSAATGGLVVLSGTGFHASYGASPHVRIAGVDLVQVTVSSPTQLDITVPAGALPPGGPYAVRVTVPEGCASAPVSAAQITVTP